MRPMQVLINFLLITLFLINLFSNNHDWDIWLAPTNLGGVMFSLGLGALPLHD